MAKKIIVYGSAQCPSCVELKEQLDARKVHYGSVEILESLAHLKKFMMLRDAQQELYKDVRERGRVGIPLMVVDDEKFYLYPEEKDLDAILAE